MLSEDVSWITEAMNPKKVDTRTMVNEYPTHRLIGTAGDLISGGFMTDAEYVGWGLVINRNSDTELFIQAVVAPKQFAIVLKRLEAFCRAKGFTTIALEPHYVYCPHAFGKHGFVTHPEVPKWMQKEVN